MTKELSILYELCLDLYKQEKAYKKEKEYQKALRIFLIKKGVEQSIKALGEAQK